MKKLFVIITLVLCAAILFSACGEKPAENTVDETEAPVIATTA